MAELIKRNKALAVSPLKSSQPLGAALAFLGIERAVPMLHGSQGCTAFAKVFFVRHFREPIPLQTTAMDQVSSVMGADDNIVEGLKAVCGKGKPALVGVPTTGLSETQGADVKRAVKNFRQTYPEFEQVKVVPVNTPDFSGCLESGYALAVRAMIDELVPASRSSGRNPRQVNVLAGSLLTPGDVEALQDIISGFGLEPVMLPDLSGSLDGRLVESEFSPVTIGGTPVADFERLGAAAATLVIGPSLYKAADLLRERTQVPDYRFEHLLGLDAVDQLMLAFSEIAGCPPPPRQERERARLQDAMLDTHFMLGQARFAIALDPDQLNAYSQFLASMGAETVAAVTPARGPALASDSLAASEVKLGDLEDLERRAAERRAQVLIGNSHVAESAARLNLPLLRAGFPLYDQIGAFQRTWIGYRGSRDCLFELANVMLHSGHGEIAPYRSRYTQKQDQPQETHHVSTASSAACH